MLNVDSTFGGVGVDISDVIFVALFFVNLCSFFFRLDIRYSFQTTQYAGNTTGYQHNHSTVMTVRTVQNFNLKPNLH